MATAAQSVTVTWGGSNIDEVFEVVLDLQREQPVARTARWTLDLGTITLRAYTRTAVPDSEYGFRKQLVITAASPLGQVFSADAIYLGSEVSAEVNGAWKFAHLFKVMDSVGGAGTYPA